MGILYLKRLMVALKWSVQFATISGAGYVSNVKLHIIGAGYVSYLN